MDKQEFKNLDVAQLDELIEQLRQQKHDITQYYSNLAKSRGEKYSNYLPQVRAKRDELDKQYVRCHQRKTYLKNRQPKDFSITKSYLWFGKQYKNLSKVEKTEYNRKIKAELREETSSKDGQEE